MKTFSEWLNEVGQSPAKIKWSKTNSEWNGSFQVKDQEFEILINTIDTCNQIEIKQFKFFRDGKTTMHNDVKYAFVVFATIQQAIDEYVKTQRPDVLLFAASDDSKTRRAMYKTQASNLAAKYKYHDLTRDKDLPNDIIFGIYKNKEHVECIKELIGL